MTVINKIRDYQSNAERDISMIDTVIHFMVHNQVFTLFICMALGFAIGDYKLVVDLVSVPRWQHLL